MINTIIWYHIWDKQKLLVKSSFFLALLHLSQLVGRYPGYLIKVYFWYFHTFFEKYSGWSRCQPSSSSTTRSVFLNSHLIYCTLSFHEFFSNWIPKNDKRSLVKPKDGKNSNSASRRLWLHYGVVLFWFFFGRIIGRLQRKSLNLSFVTF